MLSITACQLWNVAAFYFNCLISYGIGAKASSWADKLSIKSNKEMSEIYPTLITPLPYAFAIWGLIFASEGISVCWQLTLPELVAVSDHIPYLFEKSSMPWRITCMLQCLWTLCFGLDKMLLSTLLLIAALFSSYATYVHNSAALSLFLSDASDKNIGFSYFMAVFPYCLHSLWLLVAANVQISIFAVSRRASSFTQLSLAILSLAMVMLVGCIAAGSLLAQIGLAKKASSLSGFHIGDKLTALLVMLWAAMSIAQNENENDRETEAKINIDCDSPHKKYSFKSPLTRMQAVMLQKFKKVVYRSLLGAFCGVFVLLAVKTYQLKS